MGDTSTIAGFALASLILIVIPGPSVLFVISRGVALGRRAAVLTVVGNSTGVLVQVLLVAAGVGSLVERSVLAYEALRLLGAAYIVFLGIQAIRNRRALSTVLDATTTRSPRHIMREGFVVGVTNPKNIVFFTAVLPQFVNPGGIAAPIQMVALGVLFVGVATVSDSLYGLVAGTARTWLASAPHRLERLGGAGGLMMLGLGTMLAVIGRRD